MLKSRSGPKRRRREVKGTGDTFPWSEVSYLREASGRQFRTRSSGGTGTEPLQSHSACTLAASSSLNLSTFQSAAGLRFISERYQEVLSTRNGVFNSAVSFRIVPSSIFHACSIANPAREMCMQNTL